MTCDKNSFALHHCTIRLLRDLSAINHPADFLLVYTITIRAIKEEADAESTVLGEENLVPRAKHQANKIAKFPIDSGVLYCLDDRCSFFGTVESVAIDLYRRDVVNYKVTGDKYLTKDLFSVKMFRCGSSVA